MNKDPINEIRNRIKSMYEFTILYNFSAIEEDEKYLNLIKIYNNKITEEIMKYEQKTGQKI